MFALVRDLAAGRDVSEIAVDPNVVRRHLLAPLAARAGMRTLRDDLIRSTAEWARLERDVPAIVDALIAAGIRVMPIKGLAYARELYASPAERPMTDIDLLVRAHDEPAAGRVLGELGFVHVPGASLHHASPWQRGNLVLDLHRGIVGPGRSRIDLEAVWSRASAGWPDGAERLEAVDALVFHLVHMVRNRLCGPLVHVVDAARLAERVDGGDATAAVERARSWGIGAGVELAWRYCQDVLAVRSDAGGWLGPSHSDVLAVRQPSAARKLVFDIATAGSPIQLAARALGYIATRMPRRIS